MIEPLSPEERDEILARNAGATGAELDAFETLLHERWTLATAPPEYWGDVELGEARRRAALAALDARISAQRDARFPQFEVAIEAVMLRHEDEPEVPE
jgi:hypothetical protein